VRVAVGQLIWSSRAAPAARTPRPQAGTLAAVSPTSGHAVQPPRAGQGATAGRQRTALQAPATARTGTGQAGALPQPGLPTCPPSVRPASAARTPSTGNQPSALPHRQHRTLPPDPARRPPDPASAPSATCPGSTGSADVRTARGDESVLTEDLSMDRLDGGTGHCASCSAVRLPVMGIGDLRRCLSWYCARMCAGVA
jgi:hypothetical protein